MPTTVVLICLALCCLTGCRSATPAPDKNGPVSYGDVVSGAEKFAFTTEPQDAIFYVVTGWSGSMGSMPIMEDNSYNHRVRRFSNLPIFIAERQVELIENKLPAVCRSGTEIKVSARIQLTSESAVNRSIPPDLHHDQPTESYYSAKILRLDGVQVRYWLCRD
jgi:hypothetical protein